ncbi:MAG: hypothetical protein ACK4N5_11595, partial [Myxococcales bacterium]
ARNRDMVIVMATGYGSRESAEDLLALGADDYVMKPYDVDELVARLRPAVNRYRDVLTLRRAAVRAAAASDRTVLVAEPDPAERERLARQLERLGHAVRFTDHPERALRGETPAALVLHRAFCTPALKDQLRELRKMTPELKVVVVSPVESLHESVAALIFGATEHLTRPIDDERLARALRHPPGEPA